MVRGGVSDPRVARIRHLNDQLSHVTEEAARIRQQRNDLIRAAYSRGDLSYGALSRAVGMTKEAVAAICVGRI